MSLHIHHYTIPCPGVERKVIYHFSDLHLAVVDPTAPAEEQQEAAKAAQSFDECRRWFAEHYQEPFDDTLTATAYFEEILRQCADGDAVLCAGDLAEHYGDGTMRMWIAT